MTLLGIPSALDDRDRVWNAIKEVMVEIWKARHNARILIPQIALINGARALPVDEDPFGEEEEEVPLPGPPALNLVEVNRAITAELDEYKLVPRIDMRETKEDAEKGKYIDPLAWWKTHASTFPTLSQIARKVLCIPATSAPAERVFSIAGLTISKLRAKLDCENASCLIFLRDNWELSEELKKTAEVEILH